MLWNGVVYTSWASHCDAFLYHGWVIGYDAKSLQQVSIYNNTTAGRGASFWTSGSAPAVDSAGNIFMNAGNGDFNANSGGPNLGESFIKLTPGPNLAATDYFTPYNYADLNSRDLDTGSSGVLLLPDSAGSPSHPHLLVSAGKEGRIYLLDRDNMGKFQSGSDSQIVQSLPGALGGLFGIPAYFNNTLYFSSTGRAMKAFPIRDAQIGAASSQTALTFGGLGGVPAVSSSGTSNGIVWLLQITGGAALYAYDATDLTKILFNSNAKAQDTLGSYVKNSTPTVANGKVYAGTGNALVVYGLAASGLPQVSAVVSSASYQPSAAPGSLISIFGVNLTSQPAQAAGFPLPGTLSGLSVAIAGEAAPLYYAGPSQINAQVPVDTPPGNAAVTVSAPAGALPPLTLAVQAAAPAIFQFGANQFAIINQDGSANTTSNPAPAGSTVQVFLTGIGRVNNPVPTGVAAAGSTSTATQAVAVTVGGLPATVAYCGLAPGFAGVDQANIALTGALAPGSYPLIITVGGVASNIAEVFIGR